MKDTNQVSELYQLCKEVYKRTGWKQEPDISYLHKYWDNHDELCVISIEEADDTLIPAYTSDYLLEKLPRYIYLQQSADGKSWGASQLQPTELRTAENAYQSINTSAVTPLRALLLLTLKLHEEGLL